MANPNSEIDENDINIANVYSVIDDSQCATYERLNKIFADDAADGHIYLRINSKPICTDNIGKNRREIEVNSGRQVWPMKRCVLICCVVSVLLAGTIALVTVVAANSRSNSEQIDQNAPDSTTSSETESTHLTTNTPVQTSQPIDSPFWTTWGALTPCSVTCGTGTHRRYRTCNTTLALPGQCLGESIHREICSLTACPVYGTWTTWASWTSCDVTCGGGFRSRYRTCNKLSLSDLECVGDDSQLTECSDWDCPDCTRTCSVGHLNDDCDTCICEDSIVTGRVTATGSGNAISVAAIFVSSAPTKLLGQSDKNGFFTLNATCTMSQLIVARDGFLDVIVNVSSSRVQVTMDAKVMPYIKEAPQSKSRLTGDNVTLCCKAHGVPDILYYEWFKDSWLLPTSSYPNGTHLLISGLIPSDSGQYSCRANSPFGSIMSPDATLDVKNMSAEFCADALQTKYINLPSDCIQPDTNSTLYSVGECTAKRCQSSGSNMSPTCRESSISCCNMQEANLRTVQCSGYQLLVPVVTNCGCGSCKATHLTINGLAKGAITGDKLIFGEVWVNGNFETYTSLTGTFSFTVSHLVRRLAVTLKDRNFERFLDAIKVIHLSEETSGTIYLEINMLQSDEPVSLNSSIQNTLTAGPSTSNAEPILMVTIPSNAFTYSNGTAFNGVVKTSLTFLDTSNITQLAYIPGTFEFVDEEGQAGNLNSLGVFNLYFEDEYGTSLSINEPIDVQIPSEVGHNVSTQDFKLWQLSSDTGIWEIMAMPIGKRRKKRSLGYVEWPLAEKNTWYNIDKIPQAENPCYFKIRLYNDLALTEEVNTLDTSLKVRIIKIHNGILDEALWPIYNPSRTCILSLCRGETGSIDVYNHDNSGEISLHAAKQTFTSTVYAHERSLDVQFLRSEDGPFFDNWRDCINSESDNKRVRFALEGTSDTYMYTVQRTINFNERPANMSLDAFLQLTRYTWYPGRDEGYRACYMKIKIDFNPINLVPIEESITVRVTSLGGTHGNIMGKILGIREVFLSNTFTNTTICIEYKCTGNIYPSIDQDFDYTNVSVSIRQPGTSLGCSVQSQSTRLVEYNTASNISNKSQIGNDTFQVLAPSNNYGTEFGVYSHTTRREENIKSASNEAETLCRKGHSTNQEFDDFGGVAVTFLCNVN